MNAQPKNEVPKKVIRYDLEINLTESSSDTSQDLTEMEDMELQVCDSKNQDEVQTIPMVNKKKCKNRNNSGSDVNTLTNSKKVQSNLIKHKKKQTPSLRVYKKGDMKKTAKSNKASSFCQKLPKMFSNRREYAENANILPIYETQINNAVFKQCLEHIPLTPEELYKLYLKYKIDGHFRVNANFPLFLAHINNATDYARKYHNLEFNYNLCKKEVGTERIPSENVNYNNDYNPTYNIGDNTFRLQNNARRNFSTQEYLMHELPNEEILNLSIMNSSIKGRTNENQNHVQIVNNINMEEYDNANFTQSNTTDFSNITYNNGFEQANKEHILDNNMTDSTYEMTTFKKSIMETKNNELLNKNYAYDVPNMGNTWSNANIGNFQWNNSLNQLNNLNVVCNVPKNISTNYNESNNKEALSDWSNEYHNMQMDVNQGYSVPNSTNHLNKDIHSGNPLPNHSIPQRNEWNNVLPSPSIHNNFGNNSYNVSAQSWNNVQPLHSSNNNNILQLNNKHNLNNIYNSSETSNMPFGKSACASKYDLNSWNENVFSPDKENIVPEYNNRNTEKNRFTHVSQQNATSATLTIPDRTNLLPKIGTFNLPSINIADELTLPNKNKNTALNDIQENSDYYDL